MFEGVASLVLYLVFVFVQTVRHRDYFLVHEPADPDVYALRPDNRAALASLGLLLVALVAVVAVVAVVGLAKIFSPAVEAGVAQLGAPTACRPA